MKTVSIKRQIHGKDSVNPTIMPSPRSLTLTLAAERERDRDSTSGLSILWQLIRLLDADQEH